MKERVEALLADFGVDLGESPELAREIDRLIGTETPARAEEALRGMRRKPRYVGSEAWLSAIRKGAESG